MFSTEGLVPIFRLWHEIDTLERVLKAAENRPKLISAYDCSPWDILEWQMLAKVSKMGIHLCSPSLEVVKLEDIFGGPNELTVANMDESSEIYETFERIFKVEKWGNVKLDEDFREQDIPDDIGMEAYEFYTNGFLFMDIFRSIPSYYERRTYTICTVGAEYLYEHDRFKIGGELKDFFKKFEGWSICVSQSAYETEWPLFLAGQRSVDDESLNRGGRPSRASDLATALIAQRIPNGLGNLTAKEVHRKIGSPPISVKTVQRVIDRTRKRQNLKDNTKT